MKLEDSYRHRRFLMKRDEPFLVGLAGWDAEPRRAIRVGVEAIHVQPTDFVPPGSTPARDQQCRPLVGALQRSNSVHEPGEFGLGDVAWHTAGPPGHVPRIEQRPIGYVLPLPGHHVPKKGGQGREIAFLCAGAQCSASVGADVLAQRRGVRQHVRAIDLCKRRDFSVGAGEPDDERAQGKREALDRARPAGQAAGRQVALDHRLHPWLGYG